MDANLIRNGYSIERRKMFISNPRHNLRNTFDMHWEQSLHERQDNIFERKKQLSQEQVKQQYHSAINKKIQQQAKLDKSSFRILPPPHQSKKNQYQDSLHHQINQYDHVKRYPVERTGRYEAKKQVQKQKNVSETVFGYDLHPDSFKRESYLSLVLGDRLSPYLPQKKKNEIHRSFAINHPVTLEY